MNHYRHATVTGDVNGQANLDPSCPMTLCDASAGGFNLNLPAPSQAEGRLVYIVNTDTQNTVNLVVPNFLFLPSPLQLYPYMIMSLFCDGTQWVPLSYTNMNPG